MSFPAFRGRSTRRQTSNVKPSVDFAKLTPFASSSGSPDTTASNTAHHSEQEINVLITGFGPNTPSTPPGKSRAPSRRHCVSRPRPAPRAGQK
ncbi:hypothetical protein V496_01248 [Pseudogymnoascus sp. VKM F-4515 (FW-2607)]|nr:hypothetical protein V496_01248 [Pseudogymnoascus sp. VKM F-4515 (FW-2607)]